jgi:hypothetical protein
VIYSVPNQQYDLAIVPSFIYQTDLMAGTSSLCRVCCPHSIVDCAGVSIPKSFAYAVTGPLLMRLPDGIAWLLCSPCAS